MAYTVKMNVTVSGARDELAIETGARAYVDRVERELGKRIEALLVITPGEKRLDIVELSVVTGFDSDIDVHRFVASAVTAAAREKGLLE